MYWDKVNSRPAADNPWYNQQHNFENTTAHWGYDFNHESIHTQNLVDSINSYWMSEFKVDGFRFDFTKGFSNTPWIGNDNWGSAYDADRINILKRMADEIWERNENAYVIFEHLSDNTEETELAEYGIMLWGNMNYNYNEATMGYHDGGKSNLSGISYQYRGWNNPHLVGYMESHDEERLMYKNLRWGNSNDTYDVTQLSTALSRMETASAFFFTIPGPKMMFQWGELGYDFSINRCSNGTVDDEGGCRLDPKPIRWDYYDYPYRYRLYQVFSALIKLRIEEDLFETTDYSLTVSGALKKIHLNSASMNATILGNFDLIEGSIAPSFQHTGTWYEYFSGTTLEVIDVNESLNLNPGEYRIYTDVELETPDIPPVTTEKVQHEIELLRIYPNPSTGNINFIQQSNGKVKFELYNITGDLVYDNQRFAYSNEIVQLNVKSDDTPLSNGIYIYKIYTKEKIAQGKLMLE
ncbi:hypothetical protein ES708_28011 [subsurface metagenome]